MTNGFSLEIDVPGGDPVRVTWSTDALSGLEAGVEDRRPAWELDGELDWTAIEALRVLSGRLGDERTVAVTAARPIAAGGHGDEIIAGALGDEEGIGGIEQTLLSREYGPDGLLRRIGLELYREDAGLPLRIAGAPTATAVSNAGGARLTSVALELRCAGLTGFGVLDVLQSR